MGHQLAWLAPTSVDSQALPCLKAAGCWLDGSGHKVTGCGILRGPGASCGGSPVGGIRVPRTPGRLPYPWTGELRPWG